VNAGAENCYLDSMTMGRTGGELGFAAWIALIACACSSGNGSAGPSGGSVSNCNDYCAHVEPVGCPADKDHAACMTECDQRISAQLAQCPSQSQAYLSCVLGGVTFHCSANGQAAISVEDIPSSCAGALADYGQCAACIAAPTDSSCLSCEKSSCCNELKATSADPSFLPYYKCTAQCADSTCQSNCNSQYPSLGTKLQAFSSCASTHCSGC
jgi:hypothetical protein